MCQELEEREDKVKTNRLKYYIIAGEASGDLHGSNLIRNLKKADPKAEFRCFGGDLMQKAGGKIALHFRKMSFIGIIEVVKQDIYILLSAKVRIYLFMVIQ